MAKTVEKITWEFDRPDHNCKCLCGCGQAGYLVKFGNWEFPVCLSCSYLDEEEILKYVTRGGQNG